MHIIQEVLRPYTSMTVNRTYEIIGVLNIWRGINMIGNVEKMLDLSISGFHRYILDENVRLDFVSRNLCAMTGFSKEELLEREGNGYASIVHPDDRECYLAFISRLRYEDVGASVSCRYRIVKGCGDVLRVNENVTVSRLEDGTLVGTSVLSDVTELYHEIDERQVLSENIPCGFMSLTCLQSCKQPKITYISSQMLKILRIPEENDEGSDFAEMYRENIYLMIPPEDRKDFSLYLDQVYSRAFPAADEIPVIRFDGTRAYLLCWVKKCINDDGGEELLITCIDTTECRRIKKDQEIKRYIKALSEVYDEIFECNFTDRTVKYLCGSELSVFKCFEDVPMNIEAAAEKLIENIVAEEDKLRVRDFFCSFYQKKQSFVDKYSNKIRYRAMSSDGTAKAYAGIMLSVDNDICLFCCRSIPDMGDVKRLKDENVSLKENIQGLVSRFAEGIAAFEIKGELVKPLYASDNVCKFFGFTQDEWLSIMRTGTQLKHFITRSSLSYDNIEELFNKGEAELTYFDFSVRRERRIKAVCSVRAPDASIPFYVMLYNVDSKVDADNTESFGTVVTIRTFGYFDVFVNGKPIAFRNKKSKELLALLVDRRGGYVTSDEAISFLWEEEPVNSVTLARYRKVALRLKNILEEYGIPDIVESVDGKRRIVTERVNCDLYDYLSGRQEHAQLFKGSYLTNYSWGENTLAELMNNIIF